MAPEREGAFIASPYSFTGPNPIREARLANKSEKAVAAVEKLFRKNPGATTDEFLEVATAADPSLEGVGKRSFNASYLLPLKRAANKGKPSKKKTARKASARKRKTTRKKKTRKKRTRKGSASGNDHVPAEARARARQLILGRDKEVLDTLGGGGDPQAAYELGARLDSYIDELAEALAS